VNYDGIVFGRTTCNIKKLLYKNILEVCVIEKGAKTLEYLLLVTKHESIKFIEQQAGKYFDPKIVEAFIKMINKI
jgi:hypothetical protein